ncbi:MAG: Rieske 2Fe-2S domain-containing protein, partial [Oricola sp.]|nr:Rieske 2Fe-2S domain-containing protein [Oricola sp.]
KDGAFVCPWHGARFDMTNGQKLDGPAPASARLMFLPTRIEGEELLYVWGETP